MTPPDPFAPARRLVEAQRNYLRNPLPPGPKVCGVCRGPKNQSDDFCDRCTLHRQTCTPALLADAVVPISYAIAHHTDLSQHSWTLYTYKSRPAASSGALRKLRALFDIYIRAHATCLATLLGGRPSHYAIVPSSSGRTSHPLQQIVQLSGMSHLDSTITDGYRAQQRPRVFTPDAFEPVQEGLTGARILIIDDTWTTGNTAQALAHRFKQAGAATVVVLVLGRWANYRTDAWKPLIDTCARHLFDPDVCSFEANGRHLHSH
jgi:hypothetical protein